MHIFKVGDLLGHRQFTNLKVKCTKVHSQTHVTIECLEDWKDEQQGHIISKKGYVFTEHKTDNLYPLGAGPPVQPAIQAPKQHCKYKTPVSLPPEAPTPLATGSIGDAYSVVHKWVARNNMTWPFCGFVGRDITLRIISRNNPQVGAHYVGHLICKGGCADA